MKISINQEMVTDKCFPIFWEFELSNKSDEEGEDHVEYIQIPIAKYFTKSNLFIDIREEDVDIFIDDYELYKTKFQYITINDTPLIFIMSEKSMPISHFTENNQEIVDKVYGLTMYNWLRNNKEDVFHLQKLFLVLQWLHTKIYSEVILMEEIDYCYNELYDLPSEIINAIKEKIFTYHYNAILHETLREVGYEILQDLGPLPEDNKEKNTSTDISAFYKNNENFRQRVDKIVTDKLENIWLSKLNDSNFKNDIVEKFKQNITSDNCSEDKVLNIIFHNEIMRSLFEQNKSLAITVNINNLAIKSNIIINLKSITNIINWLYGSLAELIGYPLVQCTLSKASNSNPLALNFKYNKKVCKEIQGNIKYYEVDYDGKEIHISNVIVDCVAPRNFIVYAKLNVKCYPSLNNKTKYLWLYNDRAVLNRLIEMPKIFDRVIKFYNNINEKTLLSCGITAHIYH